MTVTTKEDALSTESEYVLVLPNGEGKDYIGLDEQQLSNILPKICGHKKNNLNFKKNNLNFKKNNLNFKLEFQYYFP